MPVTRASEPVIGVDSTMSSALPAGGPSRMSVSTTSASSRSTMRCAVVEPTNPPPTTVTFFRMSAFSCSSSKISSRSQQAAPAALPHAIGSYLATARLHVLDDGGGEFGGVQFRCAFHQPFEIVGDALLADGALDAVFDQACPLRVQPMKSNIIAPESMTELGIDDVLVGVFRRGAVRGFEAAVAVADVGAGRHAQSADLRGAGVGDVVAVQVGRGQDLIFVGARHDLLEDGVGDAVVDHDLLLPLALAVRRVDRVEHRLHFVADGFAEGFGALLQAGLDQRGVLLDGELRDSCRDCR